MEVNRKGWRQIGIEPMMFLYMFAFMITSVIEDAFFVYKACRVDLGYPEEICRNISQPIYEEYKIKAQLISSTFYQWFNISYHIFPIVLAFFVGAWSDQVGRKLPILIGIAGNLYYSSMIVLIALQNTWSLYTVVWLASFPCAMTGSSLTVFMAAFSYLADTTTPEQRTLRTAFVEVAYLLPMPLGVALGSYLFYNVVNQSFAVMFAISAVLHGSAMLVACLLLDWKTNTSPRQLGQTNRICTLYHVTDSIKALIKPRENNKRLLLLLSLLAMALYTGQRDEKPMLYLYAQKKFNWDVSDFSTFRTFQSSFFVAGLLIGVPILVRLLKVRDTIVIIIGSLSHALARIFFIAGNSSAWLYRGAVVACLGPVVPSVLRSFVSKLIPSSDRGKVFALLSVTDTAVPIVSTPIYTHVYNAAMLTHPELIFVVTLVTQLGVFLIGVTLTLMNRQSDLEESPENEKDTNEVSTLTT